MPTVLQRLTQLDIALAGAGVETSASAVAALAHRLHDSQDALEIGRSSTRSKLRLNRCFVDALRHEARDEGIGPSADDGLANLHRLVESVSDRRNNL